MKDRLVEHKMLKKKPSTAEKKRKHSQSEERSGKRRNSESHLEAPEDYAAVLEESPIRSTGCGQVSSRISWLDMIYSLESMHMKYIQDSKDELADPELDKIGSDIEEGGLDLSLPFQPITAYISDKQEMLEQCFRVLGEKKLRKMLPDELKDCGLVEIKALCWKQLEPICEKTLLHILAGEDLTPGNENLDRTLESQQDNNVDSTSCFRETGKNEYAKQEGGGSGEESDVLSINADTYDSDIEGPKEEQTAKAADATARAGDGSGEGSDRAVNPEPKKDIQSDIDKSVSEILAFSSTLSKDEVKEAGGQPQSADIISPGQAGPPVSGNPAVSQPSVQQLALLELEMRARAIKALMKASDGKKLSKAKNI